MAKSNVVTNEFCLLCKHFKYDKGSPYPYTCCGSTTAFTRRVPQCSEFRDRQEEEKAQNRKEESQARKEENRRLEELEKEKARARKEELRQNEKLEEKRAQARKEENKRLEELEKERTRARKEELRELRELDEKKQRAQQDLQDAAAQLEISKSIISVSLIAVDDRNKAKHSLQILWDSSLFQKRYGFAYTEINKNPDLCNIFEELLEEAALAEAENVVNSLDKENLPYKLAEIYSKRGKYLHETIPTVGVVKAIVCNKLLETKLGFIVKECLQEAIQSNKGVLKKLLNLYDLLKYEEETHPLNFTLQLLPLDLEKLLSEELDFKTLNDWAVFEIHYKIFEGLVIFRQQLLEAIKKRLALSIELTVKHFKSENSNEVISKLVDVFFNELISKEDVSRLHTLYREIALQHKVTHRPVSEVLSYMLLLFVLIIVVSVNFFNPRVEYTGPFVLFYFTITVVLALRAAIKSIIQSSKKRKSMQYKEELEKLLPSQISLLFLTYFDQMDAFVTKSHLDVTNKIVIASQQAGLAQDPDLVAILVSDAEKFDQIKKGLSEGIMEKVSQELCKKILD